MKRVLLTALSCIVFSNFSYASILLDRVVAVVNREIITWSELYKAMSFEYETQIKGMKREEKSRFFESVQRDFLEKLIDIRLQVEEVGKFGFSVSNKEIEAAIKNIRTQYGLSENQFKEALSREGFVYEDYVNRLREQILITKFVNGEIKSKIIIREQEVDDYIRENREELPVEYLFKLAQIQFSVPRNSEEKRIIDESLQRIQKSIEKGIGFGEIIALYSSKPLVQFAGETDYLKASELRSDIMRILWGMQEGEISNPIYSDSGIFVMQIVKKELPVKLEVIKDKIRKILRDNKSNEMYIGWVKKLRRRAFIEIKF